MEETNHTKQETLSEKFKDYKFRIDWADIEQYDPENEMVDVIITTQDRREYWANFTTLKFLQYMFEKNRRTGELLSGTYFCMHDNMVIVERLTEDDIGATIDDLIRKGEIGGYFQNFGQEDPEESVSEQKPLDYFIEGLKELKRRYDSKELDAESTYTALERLDKEFEKSPYWHDIGFGNQFYGLYNDLESRCSKELRLEEKRILEWEKKRERFRDYEFRIDWTDSRPYNEEDEMIDIVLTTQDGQEYRANFTTLRYLEGVFEKNRSTGALLSGTYFCMPGNMVIVERLTEDKIKATIDALIEDYAVEGYFRRAD